MITNAFLCYTAGKQDSAKLLRPYGQEPCGDYLTYISKNYGVLLPPPKDYPQSWEPILDRYKSLTQAAVDSAYTTIPILSMKIEKNNAFIFAILVNTMALMTFRLSLKEVECIRDMIPLIKSKLEIKVILNSHIFAKPRSPSFSFWWFLFIPAVVSQADHEEIRPTAEHRHRQASGLLRGNERN
jgi:hypothetical protein